MDVHTRAMSDSGRLSWLVICSRKSCKDVNHGFAVSFLTVLDPESHAHQSMKAHNR